MLGRFKEFIFGIPPRPVVQPDITLKEGSLPFAPQDFDPYVYPEQQGNYRTYSSGWGDGVGIGDTVTVGGVNLKFLGRDQGTRKYFYEVVASELEAE
ncbi:hypothetical protein HY032_00690 [Candidatus Gottesmanbacteria bacterium]|nr:hypothetical protein [Candidatus Gottesmanbacteria bacterium]